ncbi:replication enhancement protein [Hybanthus yellow mosaic virus]|uniref:Replication enhancer n=1 Tax=Hybanthus yellow mosaic virus TaxID=1884874 RepID=A0A6J3UEJ1_9GEMI|nr:replication enhancement protein [Hybanthus yellow mosaic virus]ANY43200.1 replication enhancement protein [Hybanthus yellow mosaic virus]
MDSRTGELITARQAESGVYIWEIENPLYFEITSVVELNRAKRYRFQIRFNHNLRKKLGLLKCWLNLMIWTPSHWNSTSFYKIFCSRINRYLDRLGVICINNVIRAVTYSVDTMDIECNELPHVIKFKLY